MRAIILAAGRGSRLRPLTDSVPKPLVRAGGEPLIFRHLRRLVACGITDIAVNISHLGGMIENAAGNGDAFGARISYSKEKTALETAGGIRLALARNLLPQEEPFLCVNADIVCNINFAALSLPKKSDCRLVMTPNPPRNPSGDFTLHKNGMLAPPSGETLTYSGVGIYRPQLFMHLPPEGKAKLLPILLDAVRRNAASGEKYNGLWHDTGTAESLAAAEKALAAQQD